METNYNSGYNKGSYNSHYQKDNELVVYSTKSGVLPQDLHPCSLGYFGVYPRGNGFVALGSSGAYRGDVRQKIYLAFDHRRILVGVCYGRQMVSLAE